MTWCASISFLNKAFGTFPLPENICLDSVTLFEYKT